jgi:hypothetical protein
MRFTTDEIHESLAIVLLKDFDETAHVGDFLSMHSWLS